MTGTIPIPRTISTLFGAVMVVAVTVHLDGLGYVVASLATTAVVVGIWIRSAATFAVLSTILAIAVGDVPLVVAALAGLAGTVYLLVRHAVGSAAVTVSAPTVVGAMSFLLVGLLAAAIPVRLAWLPLLAPVAAVAVYLLVIYPFRHNDTVW